MDLWIRSQNRKILSKTSEIYIDDTDENEIIIFNYDSDILGVYKSKERALEVLDEIDNLMSNAVNNGLKVARYEMPKE